MRRVRHAWVLSLLAALATGCASSGSGEKLTPDVAAPTLNQPADRASATIAPTSTNAPPAATAAPRPVETRHVIPDEVKGKAPLDPRWEYRMYHYLPVNERGQHELGLLVRQMTPDGWEIYQVQVAPRGHSQVIFRRPKVRGNPVTPEPKPLDVAKPPTGTGAVTRPAAPVDGPGTPSPLPPAPAR